MTHAVYIVLLTISLVGLFYAWSGLLESLAMRHPYFILIGFVLSLLNLFTASYWFARLVL